MIAVALLAYTVSKADYNWKKVIITGIGLALTAYFIRMLPITFGVHTLILIALLFLSLIKFCAVVTVNGILGSVVAFVALVVFETISVMTLLQMFSITTEVVAENQYLRTLVGIPHIILLVLSSFLLKKFSVRSSKDVF